MPVDEIRSEDSGYTKAMQDQECRPFAGPLPELDPGDDAASYGNWDFGFIDAVPRSSFCLGFPSFEKLVSIDAIRAGSSIHEEYGFPETTPAKADSLLYIVLCPS